MASKRTVVGTLLVASVVAATVGGLVVLGSPGEERLRKIDSRRVMDLIGLSDEIDAYSMRHTRLPSSANDLTQEFPKGAPLLDPVSGAAYEYHQVDSATYELCAGFDRPSQEERYSITHQWAHGSGRQCFRRKVRSLSP